MRLMRRLERQRCSDSCGRLRPVHRPGSMSVHGRAVVCVVVPCVVALLMPATGCQRLVKPTDSQAPAFEDILKIDVHSHLYEDNALLVDMLRRSRIHVVNVAVGGTDGHIEIMHRIAEDLHVRYPDLFSFASTFDLTEIDDRDFSQRTIRWLDETFERGAIMTKIWKEIGLKLRTPSREFLLPNDPIFDGIYAHLARRGKPLMAHIAEPLDAWLPLDPESVHYGYYSTTPEWHLYGREEFPRHAELIAARDNIMVKHPDLVVIGAHLASLEHDVDEVADRLERYPNFYVDVAARTRDLSRQPTEKVRNFFLEYEDRILYGLDASWRPYRDGPRTDDERIAFVTRLEQRYRSDYAFYAGTGTVEYAGRIVPALGLPRRVLEKFYSRNAIRLLPGLASARASGGDR
jgi:predicted TIM-barrel fold metal-dependent hydrolase